MLGIQPRLLSLSHPLQHFYTLRRFLSLSPKQVFRRFLGPFTGTVSSAMNAITQSARKNYSPTSAPRPLLTKHGGSDVGDWFAKVHSWMLALAVRACRRRLLEISGWRDDQAGANLSPIQFRIVSRGFTEVDWTPLHLLCAACRHPLGLTLRQGGRIFEPNHMAELFT